MSSTMLPFDAICSSAPCFPTQAKSVGAFWFMLLSDMTLMHMVVVDNSLVFGDWPLWVALLIVVVFLVWPRVSVLMSVVSHASLYVLHLWNGIALRSDHPRHFLFRTSSPHACGVWLCASMAAHCVSRPAGSIHCTRQQWERTTPGSIASAAVGV